MRTSAAKKVDQFAVLDSEGSEHLVITFSIITIRTHPTHSPEPGREVFELEDGQPVTALADGLFIVDSTGAFLFRKRQGV